MAASAGGADLCTGGTASASSTYPGGPQYLPSVAFDDTPSTFWVGDVNVIAVWLEYQFASPVAIVEYRLLGDAQGSGGVPRYAPRAWTFEYFDGAAWQVVDTRTNQTG